MAHAYLSDDWHWEPMLVAETILTKNNIQYIILGSAAIQHHWLKCREKDRASQLSPLPWNFANTFEIGIPKKNIDKAVEHLCKDNLFKIQDDENYDTMYEGTSLLTKLRSTWDRFGVINMILLPTEEYYVVGHTLPPRDGTCSYMCELAFAQVNELVLSLLHRKLVHMDHTAGHVLHRLHPFYLRLNAEKGVKPPANWAGKVREEATLWLLERGLLLNQFRNKAGFGSKVRRGIFGNAVPQREEKTPATRDLFGPGPPAVDVGQKRKADAEEDGDGELFGQKRAKDTVVGHFWV